MIHVLARNVFHVGPRGAVADAIVASIFAYVVPMVTWLCELEHLWCRKSVVGDRLLHGDEEEDFVVPDVLGVSVIDARDWSGSAEPVPVG